MCDRSLGSQIFLAFFYLSAFFFFFFVGLGWLKKQNILDKQNICTEERLMCISDDK